MPFVPSKKKALLMPSGPAHDLDRKHLFVILTEASKTGHYLLVPISSIKEGRFYDPTCEVATGEHPFVTTKSSLEYRFIQLKHGTAIIKGIESTLFIEKEAISESLYQRICAGITVSRHIPKWAIKDFQNWPN